MRGFGLLRKYPAFARFWLAEAISLAGDWFALVAVSVLAVQHGGGQGAWAVAVTLAAHELPMALMRPVAGVLADRFDRRNLLVGVHVGQALLTLAMVERASHADIASLQGLLLVRSLLAGLDWPARSGAMRRLVDADDLIAVNAFGGATWSAMYAVGMALGGVVSSLGVPLALACDAATFGLAALLLCTLPPMPTRGEGSLLVALSRAAGDLREAARAAVADPLLLRAVASKTPLSVAGGAGVVLLNVLADATAFAGSGAVSLGLLQATRGIGTGVGPLVAERLVAAGFPLSRVWAAVVFVGFGGIATLACTSRWMAMLAACAIWGMGTGANWMLSSAELQRRSPDVLIGRLSGLDMLMAELAFGLSALVGGLVIEWTGYPSAAAAMVIVAVLFWSALRLATRG